MVTVTVIVLVLVLVLLLTTIIVTIMVTTNNKATGMSTNLFRRRLLRHQERAQGNSDRKQVYIIVQLNSNSKIVTY